MIRQLSNLKLKKEFVFKCRLASKLQPECFYTMARIHLFIEPLLGGKETFDSLYRAYISCRYQPRLGAVSLFMSHLASET